MRVDFPALGTPMIPISATSFSSRNKSCSSGISPSSANAGACLVELVKWAFQKPPLQPEAISTFIPFVLISTISSIVSLFRTSVQTGTFKIRS